MPLSATVDGMLAHLAERRARAQAEFLARGGICWHCLDTGRVAGNPLGEPCGVCPAGQRLGVELHAERVREQIAAAGVPPRFAGLTLASFPAQEIWAYGEVRAFLDAWDERRGLMLLGEVGVGKTGLLAGALRAILERHFLRRERVVWYSGVDLLNDLKAGFGKAGAASYEGRLRAASVARLLILDDLGAEKDTAWAQEQLFAIINARHGNLLPTFLTSNLGTDVLAHGSRLGPRVMDRLIETCEIIEVEGPNLRRQRR